MRTIYDKIIGILDHEYYEIDFKNNKERKQAQNHEKGQPKGSRKREIQSQYYYYKGKTLDLMSESLKEAEELLSKSVKLKPWWNEPLCALAHVYWK